jgi:hypothetical protein
MDERKFFKKKDFRDSSDEEISVLPASPDSITQHESKEKFEETKRRVKVTILTLLPRDWSIKEIGEEFPSTTNYKTCTAKQIVKEYGIVAALKEFKPRRCLRCWKLVSANLCYDKKKSTIWQST